MNGLPDSKQREDALNPLKSFIVQAPAGSGKTELLIQRYLTLLSGVNKPEQILAMTFTRKAAAEMNGRILEALEQAADNQEPTSSHHRATLNLAKKVLKHDREKQWRLLESPARLKVQTIDSFCASIVKQMPLLSGQGSSLSLQEKPIELYREAAERVLRFVECTDETGGHVRRILRRLDNNKRAFRDHLVHLYEKRDQWYISFFEKGLLIRHDPRKIENLLKGLIESKLRLAHSLIPDEIKSNLPPLLAFCARNLAQEKSDDPIACLQNLDKFPEPLATSLAMWKGLSRSLLTEKGELRKPRGVTRKLGFPENDSNKQAFQDILAALASEPQLQKALLAVRLLPNPEFSEGEWLALQAMTSLLPVMEEELQSLFRQRGKTDFSELALSALQGLDEADNPSELLLNLDSRIEHLLIDEYQDTSYKQQELLKRLISGWTEGDGRTLFIVGDPMQSIYGFRDAEVSLFLNTKEYGIPRDGMVPLRLTPIQLETNFRSQPAVVDWFNQCFKTIFPLQDDPASGSIRFTPSTAHQPPCPELEGMVMHAQPDDGGAGEAIEVARMVSEIQQSHPEDSIVILIRSRTHLLEIVRQLDEQGIPYHAEDIDPLTTRPFIVDLLALMRALLSPQDRTAWLSILRAPWCGVSLADLHILCTEDDSTSISMLIQDQARIRQLSSDGQHRIRRFAHIMKPVLDSLGRMDFRRLLEGAWVALGGPCCIRTSELSDVEVFFSKVSEVVRDNDFRLLRHFDRLLSNLYSRPHQSDQEQVHIMTMHGAKGLEFDFVLLPGLGRGFKSEVKRLIHWAPIGDEILMAPIQETHGAPSPIHEFIKSLNNEKDRFEILRLLYVAITRTRKQLHLFGHLIESKDGAKPKKNSLFHFLWPFLKESWPLPEPDSLPEEATSSQTEATPLDQSIKRLPSNYSPPQAPSGILTEDSSEPSPDENEDPEFEWAGFAARALGNVLHRMFKDMTDPDFGPVNAERIHELGPGLESALIGEGLSADQARIERQTAERALNNMLNDKTGRWILFPHSSHQSEYSISAWMHGHYITRVLDRTFIDEQGQRWIIDYKTREHSGGNLEVFFGNEMERYRPQLEEYEALLRLQGETNAILKALYYPMHQRLIQLD